MDEPNDCRAVIVALGWMWIDAEAIVLAETATSSYRLVCTCQRRVGCQRKVLLMAEHTNQPLLLVQGLKKLFAD